MRITQFLLVLGLTAMLAPGVIRAETPEGEAPSIKHVPVTKAIRSVPVNLGATIAATAGSSVTSATVLVRLTDAGTPIRTPMAGSEDNLYSANLPVTMFRSVSVFWYALEARDELNRIGGTPWIRVVIADPITQEGGVTAKEGRHWKKAAWIGGGLLAAGGAVAIVAAQDDNDDGEPTAPADTPPPPKGNDPAPADTGGGGGSPDLSGLTNFICNVTGRETVSYQNLSRCDGVEDILILVCYTCVNADIQAVASWGEVSSITGYSNVACNNSAPRLRLAKPRGFPTPGTETITVSVNGVVIATEVWPPLSDNSCF